MNSFTESIVEDAALASFESHSYGIESGPDIALPRLKRH